MKLNRLTSIIIVICSLLLQAGCEEETMTSRQLDPDWFFKTNWPTSTQMPSAPPVAKRIAKEPAPRITFEKVTHDFGNIGPATKNICEFKFTNTGDGILKIIDIVKTCGCTPFLLDKKEYMPGDSGTLKVGYLSDTQYGKTTKYLHVHSNDRANPQVALAIKARIIAKVDFKPKSLNLLLKQENGGCPKITLISLDNQPFSITHFRSTGNSITADYNPSMKATSFVLQPKVNMDRLAQNPRGHIEIGLSHPECNSVTIGLNTLSRFTVSPRTIVIRGAEPEKPIEKTVRIVNNYNEEFELDSPIPTGNIIKIVEQEKTKNGYELKLEITPPAIQGTTRVFSEVLSLNIKGGNRLEVPCNGFYQGSTDEAASTEDPDCETCDAKIIPW